MTAGLRVPREHGGWSMELAASVGGAWIAVAHGMPLARAGTCLAGLTCWYAAGDWLQSVAAAVLGAPFRGRSDPRAWPGPALVIAGAAGAWAGRPDAVPPAAWLAALAVYAAVAGAVVAARAFRPPFDRALLAAGGFALSLPAGLFALAAWPAGVGSPLACWAWPAAVFPAAAWWLEPRVRAAGSPAAVRRLGWTAAALTLLLAAGWIAAFAGR